MECHVSEFINNGLCGNRVILSIDLIKTAGFVSPGPALSSGPSVSAWRRQTQASVSHQLGADPTEIILQRVPNIKIIIFPVRQVL
jgi:hypothetical protein